METQDLEELLALEKNFYKKLVETTDLTRELAEAVDRQDQVSVRLLLSMRQRPMLELQEIQNYVALKRVDLELSDAIQFDQLLEGAATENQEEKAVTDQIASNRRLLGKLVELDRRINQKLCGEKSCYGST